MLPHRTYVPSSALGLAGTCKGGTAGESAYLSITKEPLIGRGDTLVLLQEARAHRMSHFQLLRLPGASL